MEYPEFSLVTRDVSNIHLTNQATSLVASDYERTTETVEELLEKGWYAAGASPVHIAIRGTPREDSVRCEWHGVARTPAQREEQIRFLLGVPDDTDLPSPADVETILTAYAEQLAPGWDERSKAWMIPLARGKLSVGYLVMSCYADYAVSEYILGRGPSTVTVAFEQTEHDYSYDVYLKAGESRGINMDDVPTRAEFREDILDPPITGAEAELKGIVEGRENVLFLIPMGVHDNIAIEAWQSVAQWDLQTDDGEVLQALRYGVDGEHDEYSQTLANLKSRIATGATSDSFARERISNISGLNQYYQDMGAYSDISPGDGNLRTFTPAKPLATLSCAGASAVTDPATKFGLVRDCSILLGLRDELRGTATLNWSENLVLGNWTGITTTGSPLRITAINLPSQSLNGIISPALGKLDALEALDLSSNSLTGLIPASLGQLPSLATLRLSGNFLSGCIPPTLRDVTTNDLASVGLSYCDMPPPPSPSE